jgi:hypothetical protein
MKISDIILEASKAERARNKKNAAQAQRDALSAERAIQQQKQQELDRHARELQRRKVASALRRPEMPVPLEEPTGAFSGAQFDAIRDTEDQTGKPIKIEFKPVSERVYYMYWVTDNIQNFDYSYRHGMYATIKANQSDELTHLYSIITDLSERHDHIGIEFNQQLFSKYPNLRVIYHRYADNPSDNIEVQI